MLKNNPFFGLDNIRCLANLTSPVISGALGTSAQPAVSANTLTDNI
jgi:hypothetical protein